MAITLKGDKELKGNKKVEKKQIDAKNEKADQNSTSNEKKQSKKGLSKEA